MAEKLTEQGLVVGLIEEEKPKEELKEEPKPKKSAKKAQ